MSKQKSRKRRQENTVLWVLLLILLVCFCVIGFLFYKFFYAGAGSNKYGDRLNGIEDYPLPKTLKEDIKGLYTEDDSIGNVNVNVEGRIIYIDITFTKPLGKGDATSKAEQSLEKIGAENLTFYEVHFVLTYDGEEENVFPIFGMKNANNLKVVW